MSLSDRPNAAAARAASASTPSDVARYAAEEARLADFFALMKPRVMALVIFTALVGMLLAPGGIHPILGIVALLAIAVGAGASAALNMWYDADIDASMARTRARPLPRGAVSHEDALVFGLALSVGSVMTLGLAVNWLAASLLAFTIVFYIAIYTMWLKRWTPQNIVIGGAAGALPPMIGWAAVAGEVSWTSFALFMLIFLWTPPHFWALALFRTEDYVRVRVPMLPVVAGERATKRQIVAYSLLLIPAGLAPALLGGVSWLSAGFAAAMGVWFTRAAIRLAQAEPGEATGRRARATFGTSIVYLFAVFAAFFVEALVLRLGFMPAALVPAGWG